jgi:hypothetical protein
MNGGRIRCIRYILYRFQFSCCNLVWEWCFSSMHIYNKHIIIVLCCGQRIVGPGRERDSCSSLWRFLVRFG